MDTQGGKLGKLPSYAYVLGFRRNASHLLRAAEQNGFLLPANARANISYEMDLDIRADDLWNLGASKPFGAIFREKPVIL